MKTISSRGILIVIAIVGFIFGCIINSGFVAVLIPGCVAIYIMFGDKLVIKNPVKIIPVSSISKEKEDINTIITALDVVKLQIEQDADKQTVISTIEGLVCHLQCFDDKMIKENS